MWLNAAFTAIICTSCYAPAFPHSLLSCWKECELSGWCPPQSEPPASIPFAFSCGSSLDLTCTVKWRNNGWNTVVSWNIFSGMLESHGLTHPVVPIWEKSLWGSLQQLPALGLSRSWASPLFCSGPRKGKNKAENKPSRLPLDHTKDPPDFVLIQCWRLLCPTSCCGIRTLLQAPFPLLPLTAWAAQAVQCFPHLWARLHI